MAGPAAAGVHLKCQYHCHCKCQCDVDSHHKHYDPPLLCCDVDAIRLLLRHPVACSGSHHTPPCLRCGVRSAKLLLQHLLACSCCTAARFNCSRNTAGILPCSDTPTAEHWCGFNAQGGLERASSTLGLDEQAPLSLQCTAGRRKGPGCRAPAQQALTWGVPSDLSQVTPHILQVLASPCMIRRTARASCCSSSCCSRSRHCAGCCSLAFWLCPSAVLQLLS